MDAIQELVRAVGAASPRELASVSIADLLALKQAVAKLETAIAHGRKSVDFTAAGMSRRQADVIIRRAANEWAPGVGYEHQDAILAELKHLSAHSVRRAEIYRLAAEAAPESSPRALGAYVKQLVREENERLDGNPEAARARRSFEVGPQDRNGMVNVRGWLTAETGALLKALMNSAFKATTPKDRSADLRTVAQRSAGAFDLVVRWASSHQVESAGHAALVVSVTEDDEMDLAARFPTNTGIDLSLVELALLSGDKVADYIAVHTHDGAVKSLVSAGRSATIWQRIALLAEQLVCQHPECDVPAGQCEAHHVQPWSRGGPTDLRNLVQMCRRHHGRNDDSHRKQHMQKRGGTGHWCEDGIRRPNNTPQARRAGGRRLALRYASARVASG